MLWLCLRRIPVPEPCRVLPFISEDGEMLALVNSTLKKMEQLTDQEFSGMDLETYAQEPAEEA